MLGSETTGGEKFFEYLQRLLQNPHVNGDLLELIHVCLSLGFQGQYRSKFNGQTVLDTVRRELAECISRTRGAYDRSLSPHGRDTTALTPALNVLRPWYVGVLCGLLLLGIYVWLRQSLSSTATPVTNAITSMEVKRALAAPMPPPRLATLLKADIDTGRLESPSQARCPGCETIILRFKSGAATLPAQDEPTVMRIGEALNQVAGSVLVTGHTDDQKPAWSSPFADNRELSQERAQSVRAVLERTVTDRSRLSHSGRADRDWIGTPAANADRAANRRVEITLRPASTPR